MPLFIPKAKDDPHSAGQIPTTVFREKEFLHTCFHTIRVLLFRGESVIPLLAGAACCKRIVCLKPPNGKSQTQSVIYLESGDR